jgi:hypothetical protein
MMLKLIDRIIRAAKLDANLYEEVEADKGAMPQSVGVVILSSLAAGIGSIGREWHINIIMGTVFALIGWFVSAYLIYFIGTKIFPEPQTESDQGELLRTIGFSSSPGMIRVFGVIPGLTGVVFIGALVWMLMATVVAVRQALDYTSTLRAIGVCVIGWVIQLSIVALFFAIWS